MFVMGTLLEATTEYLKGICVATRRAQNMRKAKTEKQTW